jgi:cytochrome c-type biogenesis protein CcmH
MTSWLVIALALGAYAPQQAGSGPLAPDLEARVQRVGKLLRCAVCQGLSITDSPASMARAQLDKVRELVAEGKTDEEVKAYFIARYGEWVLLDPPAKGTNWIVWLGPLALVLFGAAAIYRVVKPKSANAPVPAAETTPQRAEEDAYLKAIRQEVDS